MLIRPRLVAQENDQPFHKVHWFLKSNLVEYCLFYVATASEFMFHADHSTPRGSDSIIVVVQSEELDGWKWPSPMWFVTKHSKV